MSDSQDNPGSTRIAAGPGSTRKLKIGIAVGVLAVLGACAAVASTSAHNTDAVAANTAAATSPAAELKTPRR